MFARTHFQKGDFVAEYRGDFVTEEEAEKTPCLCGIHVRIQMERKNLVVFISLMLHN